MTSANQHRQQSSLGSLLGESVGIKQVIQIIRQVAPSEIAVLITGESGTGKELVARAIHELSLRRDRALMTVNCGAIPEGIFESEIFGHEKGAFTSAEKMRRGYFELANGGTVFLDEIGEMPVSAQVKILRILETGEFMRVGSGDVLKTDVRIIAASNRDLAQAVSVGEFRQDLYFRLKAVNVVIPPLRERREDIPLLADHFVGAFCEQNKIPMPEITAEGYRVLQNHDWEGNVRELKNTLESMVILERGLPLDADTIRRHIAGQRVGEPLLPVHVGRPSEQLEREMIYRVLLDLKRELGEIRQMLMSGAAPRYSGRWQRGMMVEEAQEVPVSLEEAEKEQIQRALEEYGGNRRKAAKALGIGERTLYRKIKQYGL
jgi:DNA-binding NtrC family response regulator